MISAFLDTNVLLGITETDLLLSLSETGGMLRPYWSEYVFDELKEHLPERLEESGSEDAFRKACRRIDAMRYAFPESMVPASKWELYSSIAEKYVNDLDDTQILAGAIACNADCLVTDNLKDFDIKGIQRLFGISTTSTDMFLQTVFHCHPTVFWDSAEKMVRRHNKPPQTLEELSNILKDHGRTGIASDMEAEARKRQITSLPRVSQHQGRDSLGRFTAIQGDDSDLFDIWGPNGNGY